MPRCGSGENKRGVLRIGQVRLSVSARLRLVRRAGAQLPIAGGAAAMTANGLAETLSSDFESMFSLLQSWDADGDGVVSASDFRLGLQVTLASGTREPQKVNLP